MATRDHLVSRFGRLILIAVTLPTLLFGCQPKDPVRIGFVGDLSGRYFLAGVGTRNGVVLAIEEINAQGGINARPVELLIRDDQHQPQVARAAVADLLANNVEAIIGPPTSAMAMSVIDLVNASQTLMVGTTVTTNDLSGLDDYFVRIMASTSYSASCLADYLQSHLGFRRYSAIYDDFNLSFSESWIGDFVNRLEAGDIDSFEKVKFTSGDIRKLANVAERALASEPEVLLLITDLTDSAVLLKQIRSLAPEIQFAMPKRAQSEKLMELAGIYMDGFVTPLYYDRDSQQPDYLRFRAAFIDRFGQVPAHTEIMGYNAAQLVLGALMDKPTGVELKSKVLEIAHFDGLQYPIILDRFGDVNVSPNVSRVENGQFSVQPFECGRP